MFHPADRHPLLLHRLEQGRLGARAGAVDLVGHQQLAEHRTADEAEAALAFGLLQDFGADDVGRHKVGGELDPLGGEAQDDAQSLHQAALAQAGNTDQQDMAAGQQGDQGLIDHLGLAEDHPADRRAHPRDARAQRFNLGEDRALLGRRHLSRIRRA